MSQVCLPWIIAQSFTNASPAARTALRTQFSQLQRTHVSPHFTSTLPAACLVKFPMRNKRVRAY